MDVDVQVIGSSSGTFATSSGMIASGGGPQGVTIISGDILDDSIRDSIRAVLQSAGHTDEVTFIDSSGGSDGKHVKVIRKHVEVVN